MTDVGEIAEILVSVQKSPLIQSKINEEIIFPILRMSTLPLNSNCAVKPLAYWMKSSESGKISANPCVWTSKNCIVV